MFIIIVQNYIFGAMISQDEAVEKVMEFMDSYSISMDDFDTIVEISKYQVALFIFIFTLFSFIFLAFMCLRMDFCFRGVQILWKGYSQLLKLL